MSRPSNNLPNVVVVGGGGAGQKIARKLSAELDPTKFNLLLVTSRPYFVHYPATIRMSVTPAGRIEDRALIPYDANFINGNGTLIVGTVEAIEPGKDASRSGGDVVLESGEKIPYSILVLATGSLWQGPLSFPRTKAETADWLDSWRTKFEKAKDIVLVGGGSVGVEFSGEVKELWPDKNVTIVHGDNQLLNASYPDKFRNYTEASLRRRGINLVLGDYLEEIPQAVGSVNLKTRKGKTIYADLVVPTFGSRPNTAFIRSSLGDQIMTPSGYIRIELTMQIPGYPRIFAAGDIIDFPEQKQVGKYGGHAAVVVANVVALLAGQKLPKVYKKGPEMVVITIGSKGGVGYFDVLWGIVVGDWFSAFVKSKWLLISMMRQSMGLKE